MTHNIAPDAQQADSTGEVNSGAGTTPEKDIDSGKTALAGNIARYRQKLKLTRAELATKVNLTEAAIGQYERGERTPQLEILSKLADVFNTPVDSIMGRGVQNYDVIKEYRFEKSREFVEALGYVVHTSNSGEVALYLRIRYAPNFCVIEGRVTADKPQRRRIATPTVIFATKEEFFIFVESLQHRFLTATDADIVLNDSITRLLHNEEFLPSLKIEMTSGNYRGSTVPF